MSARYAVRLALILWLALLVAGCAQQPQRSAATQVCGCGRVIQVVSHGWHTGIVLGREDLAKSLPAIAGDLGEHQYVEIGWGDGEYYPAEKGSLRLALRALFRPTPSVLQVVPFTGPPHEYFPGSGVAEVPLDEAGYRAVLGFVAETFRRTPAGGVVRLGPSQYGEGWFYAAEGSFHAFNTCNTWVARGMRKAGFAISPGTVTARGLYSQLPRGGC